MAITHQPSFEELDLRNYRTRRVPVKGAIAPTPVTEPVEVRAPYSLWVTLEEAASQWMLSEQDAKRFVKKHGLPHKFWKLDANAGESPKRWKRMMVLPAEAVVLGCQKRGES